MPNTLVHLGIQGFAYRLYDRKLDLRLVYLSCIIPDIPWILQRAIHAVWPDLDRIDLMLRSGAQSSLFFCVVFAGAFAVIARRPTSAFLILSSGSLFHLLLDITQIKWGRGSIFWAPLDWHIAAWELAWPENPLFYVLSVFGVVFVVATWRSIDHAPIFRRGPIWRYGIAAILLGFYFLGPLHYARNLYEIDAYSAKVYSNPEARSGKVVVMDRASLLRGEDGRTMVRDYTGELLILEGADYLPDHLISVKGRFTLPDTVVALDFHHHPANDRIIASILGLALVCALWLQSFYRWARTSAMARRQRE